MPAAAARIVRSRVGAGAYPGNGGVGAWLGRDGTVRALVIEGNRTDPA